MKKISKGTFVFEKSSVCSAGFFISAKKTMRRGAFGFGPTWEPEILIEDLWNGKTTGLMSLDSTDELSTDKKLFTTLVTELITSYKKTLEAEKQFMTPVQKRKVTNYEKKKVTPKTVKEKLKSLAMDLEFYETVAKEVESQVRAA